MIRGTPRLFRGLCGSLDFGRLPTALQSTRFGQSVDLRMPFDEYVDLLSAEDGEPNSPSGVSLWSSNQFSHSAFLNANESIQMSRERPMCGDYKGRLSDLWKLSGSHGVAWDALDEAFLTFHREFIERQAEWVANYDAVWSREYKESERVLGESLKCEEPEKTLTLNRRRGKIRRMTYARMSRLRFSRVLKPFHHRQLNEYLNAFVTRRVLQREEAERSLS